MSVRLLDEAKTFFWLRRIAIAVEKNAEATERLAKILETEYANVTHPKPPRKKMELGVMEPDEVNKQFLRQLEAERDGIELDE
jgi:hypothetical protein